MFTLYSEDDNKYELLTIKDMLLPQASRQTERKNFEYSRLVQMLHKQVNTNQEQREKHVKIAQG